jgi:acyl carrier protein
LGNDSLYKGIGGITRAKKHNGRVILQANSMENGKNYQIIKEDSNMNYHQKIEAVAELLDVGVDQISIDTHLDTLNNWDSMGKLSLIILLEEKFNRTDIDSAKINSLKKIKDVLAVMEIE